MVLRRAKWELEYEVWLERGRFGVSNCILIVGLIIDRLKDILKID